ncbi:MAG: M56 family metallopeptidase [Bacteroidota bacterium]|nr:M56 family metallopeptidase [Bacteroidota bacterium]
MLQLPTFFTQLGTAIIYNILQAAIIWLVYVLIKKSLPLKIALHFNVALVGIFSIFLFFLFSCYNVFALAPTRVYETRFGNYFSIQHVAFLMSSSSYLIEYFLNGISVLYLIILLIQILKWPLIIQHQNKIHTHYLQQAPNNICNFIELQKKRFNIKKNISVFVTNGIQSPMTIGFLKPVILFPLAGITHLSTTAIETILLHELAHIKRMDYFINLIVQIIHSFIYFNPFIYLLKVEMRHSRELCCDAFVLEQNYEPVFYANTLFKLAQISHYSNAALLSMPAVQHKGELLLRIQNILQKPHSQLLPFSNFIQWIGNSAIALICLLLINVLPVQNNVFKNKGEQLPETYRNLNWAAVPLHSLKEPQQSVVSHKASNTSKNVIKSAAIAKKQNNLEAIASSSNTNSLPAIFDKSLPLHSYSELNDDKYSNDFTFIQSKEILSDNKMGVDELSFNIKKISSINYSTKFGYTLYLIQRKNIESHAMQSIGFILLLKNNEIGVDGMSHSIIYRYLPFVEAKDFNMPNLMVDSLHVNEFIN